MTGVQTCALPIYTTDGSEPTADSPTYDQPFTIEQPTLLKAIAFDPASKQSSPITEEPFDIARTSWNILHTSDAQAAQILDGDPATMWQQEGTRMPTDLVIDLASEQSLKGFRYLPDQSRYAKGIIFNYEFAVSTDGKNWQKVNEGEFSNIKNNPLWQTRSFDPVSARFVRLRALRNTEGNQGAGYAEFDIVTTH